MNIYSKFSQYYIEMLDRYRGLLDDVQEYNESGEELPLMLKSEYSRHKFIVEMLEDEGMKKYGKNQKELYRDGWDFWFQEDKMLREERYGKRGMK